MPTKAEKEREARILARKKEVEKKAEERKEKEAKIIKRIDESRAATFKAHVKLFECGIIVEVLNTVQAKLAQAAGFNAICPYNYPEEMTMSRNGNPVTSDPRVIREMMNSVLIPIMANVRIGHTIEAKMAAHLGASIINEHEYAEVSEATCMSKKGFKVPFMAGVENLAECILRIEDGATMLRTKAEDEDKNFSHTITTVKAILKQLKVMHAGVAKTSGESNKAYTPSDAAIDAADAAKYKLLESDEFDNRKPPMEIINRVIKEGKLPVPFYGYGGVCTPNDVAMLRRVGCGAIISNIAFKADNPRRQLRMLVEASANYNKAAKMAELSIGTNGQYYPEEEEEDDDD